MDLLDLDDSWSTIPAPATTPPSMSTSSSPIIPPFFFPSTPPLPSRSSASPRTAQPQNIAAPVAAPVKQRSTLHQMYSRPPPPPPPVVNIAAPPPNIIPALMMPLPNSKYAPLKFKGEYDQIERFILTYEALCQQHNVLDDESKCKTITQYCSRKTADFIQALESYQNPDWDQLKKDLLKYFDADRCTKRYLKRDLTKYIKATREKKMATLQAWRKYARGFLSIAGWLRSTNKISEEEEASYFWGGIGYRLRDKIENRLYALHPTYNRSHPFSMEEVNEIAESILQRNKFDVDFDESDSDDKEWPGKQDSDDDSNDSDEDERLRQIKLRKQLTESALAKQRQSQKVHFARDEEPEMVKVHPSLGHQGTNIKSTQHEVEEMIQQLNSMNPRDPQYGLVYYRAIKKDEFVSKVVRAPELQSQSRSYVASGNSMVNRPRDPPPHLLPARPTGNTNTVSVSPGVTARSPDGNRPPPRSFTCYGCNKEGHTMNTYIRTGTGSVASAMRAL
ncbi:hypothetical protein DENSPDRAFT_840269 [Dentipellis sp. KUC8613]|nr:hypothetical protein DENSPDRAFT_840269 [Dentipellis sp. KUC8613]